MHKSDVIILRTVDEVLPYVDSVRRAADASRDELGFLPDIVYAEAARAANLYVAVSTAVSSAKYLGHLLFSRTYPNAKVVQAYVSPQARGSAVGSLLLSTLIEYLEQREYLTISARVASELRANSFYQKNQFEVVRQQAGGVSRNRLINLRVRQLTTRTLFGYPAGQRTSGLASARPTPKITPTFGIDLNVFFDVVSQRLRHEYAGRVIAAGLSHLIKVVVSQEFTNELRRTAESTKRDPILEFALQLPNVPNMDGQSTSHILSEIAAIVFPHKNSSQLTIQDRSDIVHIAAAIANKLTGFVTAENALVRAAPQIEEKFGTRVIHVEELAARLTAIERSSSPVQSNLIGVELSIYEISPVSRELVLGLVKSMNSAPDLEVAILNNGTEFIHQRITCVSASGKNICAAVSDRTQLLHGKVQAFVLLDEEQPNGELALDALLYALEAYATKNGTSFIEITVSSSHELAQRALIRFGYSHCANTSSTLVSFQRVVWHGVIYEENWSKLRAGLQRVTGNRLDGSFPTLPTEGSQIRFEDQNGQTLVISRADLETALAPSLFIVESRPFVVVPIRRRFADELLGTAEQKSLLPYAAAGLLHERVYYSSPRNQGLLEEGAVVIFYESGKDGGRSSAIAVAKVKRSYLQSKRHVAADLLRLGVLQEPEIDELTESDEILISVMQNVQALPKGIPLERLKQLDCADGANLVGPKRISREAFLNAILEAGLGG